MTILGTIIISTLTTLIIAEIKKAYREYKFKKMMREFEIEIDAPSIKGECVGFPRVLTSAEITELYNSGSSLSRNSLAEDIKKFNPEMVLKNWNGPRKLTKEETLKVAKEKGTQEAIGKKYGVSRSRVGQIKRTHAKSK